MQEEKPAPQTKTQEHLSPAHKTILFAEDDPNAMLIVKMLLKPVGAICCIITVMPLCMAALPKQTPFYE